MPLTIELIEYRFHRREPRYLKIEEAIAYTCHCLLEKDCYLSQLMQEIPEGFALSDTISTAALGWIKRQGWVSQYLGKSRASRGRPRRMYSATAESRTQVQRLARLWDNHIKATHHEQIKEGY